MERREGKGVEGVEYWPEEKRMTCMGMCLLMRTRRD